MKIVFININLILAKELEFEEEFKIPEFTELANPETWVHVPPMILKQGRTTLYMEGLSEE